GLPWPTSPTAGAARFRSATGSTSYRALVSFAALELALDAGAAQGSVNLAAIGAGQWRSDLLDYRGSTNQTSRVVVGHPGGWLTAPCAGNPSLAGLLGSVGLLQNACPAGSLVNLEGIANTIAGLTAPN
ncbi:MAG: hypothetical protein ACRD0F_01325, partial [Acidimicrobiales bacterium]